jgi:hypothetical protein
MQPNAFPLVDNIRVQQEGFPRDPDRDLDALRSLFQVPERDVAKRSDNVADNLDAYNSSLDIHDEICVQ